MKPLKILLILVFISACASRTKSITASHIGCPEDEIELDGSGFGIGASTWKAKCRGKTFYCSAVAVPGSQYSAGNSNITCKEEIPK